MERPSAWSLATRQAGMTALGASAFPLPALAVGAMTRSVPQAFQIAQMGTILLGTAVLVTIIGTIAGGRNAYEGSPPGCGWIGGSVISLMGQLVLAVLVALIWKGLGTRGAAPSRYERADPRTNAPHPPRQR